MLRTREYQCAAYTHPRAFENKTVLAVNPACREGENFDDNPANSRKIVLQPTSLMGLKKPVKNKTILFNMLHTPFFQKIIKLARTLVIIKKHLAF
jgi:hypothetical protein